jgi:hypothetical protein
MKHRFSGFFVVHSAAAIFRRWRRKNHFRLELLSHPENGAISIVTLSFPAKKDIMDSLFRLQVEFRYLSEQVHVP